jgi:hypothetical protein
LLRLLTIGPTLLSLPFAALYNSATYFLYRPKRGFGRHLGVNVFRYLGTVVRMGLVAAPDHEAWDIPKLAQKHFLGNAEVGEVRAIPPIRDDVPRLPVLSSGGDAIAPPEDIPGFMLAPKGTPKEEVWAKAKPGEKGIFYLIGGGYEVGHPLKFFCIWEIVRDTGLRSFCKPINQVDAVLIPAPNFRKTVRADQAWPTQVWDILAGWQYMVDELGFEPQVSLPDYRASLRQNIVVTGSSAGGHATLTLVRYLDELLQQGWDKWGMPAGFYASAVSGDDPALLTLASW